MPKSSMNKSAEYEPYFQELGNKENRLFESMKDVYMFAIAIGFKRGKKIPLGKTGGEAIALRYFNDDDKKLMDLIALAAKDDISILLADDEIQDEKYKLLEEYANGGMSIMVEEFCKPIIDKDALFKFVSSYEKDEDAGNKKSIEELLLGASKNLSFD